MERFDAIVIGAGEAGSEVASRAVEAGKRVALIYRPPFGSTCLNVGCVPSKFLIHRARIAHVARTAARFHVIANPPRVELDPIIGEKTTMIDQHRAHSLAQARDAERLELIEGSARFASPREVEVGNRRLRANRIFIATGLRPARPEIPGLDSRRALDSESLMELRSVPARLVVLGGGYVACELGQAFRRFGAEVVVVQTRAHLLPREEPDVSTVLERAFRAEGIELVLGSRPSRVSHGAGAVRITARARDGREQIIEGSHLLVATGRVPNTESLGLSAAGVAADQAGHVKVDARLRTATQGVWAIGDVNGHQPFTRVCQEEGKLAFANAFQGKRLAIQRASLGHAVFTDPEIGSVGLTEAAARARGFEVAAGLVTFDQVERAQLIGDTAGLIKFVVDRSDRRILGCHVIGQGAAELVYSVTVLMRQRGTIDQLGRSVGIFPTLQEGIEGTARGVWRGLTPDEARGPLVAGRSS
jgi:pyruvate/2-oxoglutarate dehydrogenase complex dihydrolipoamide dehydrogenase (E3) component